MFLKGQASVKRPPVATRTDCHWSHAPCLNTESVMDQNYMSELPANSKMKRKKKWERQGKGGFIATKEGIAFFINVGPSLNEPF